MTRGHVIDKGAGILRRLLAGLVAALTITTPATAAPEWQYQWPKWLPPVWQRIARCETGMRWNWNSGTYQGAFGFYRGSWHQFRYPSYPREAYLATPWQQYRVALRIHAKYGYSGWGCWTNRAWVRGE